MSPASSPVYFGSFEVNPRSGELRKNGLKIRLGEQPFQVLAMLLEHPGQVVTREELQRRLWSSDTFVDFEQSLNAAVTRLREALCDSADHPRFIETLPRHGYRLIVPVELTSPASVPGQVNGPGTSDKVASLPWWRTRATAYLGIILFLLAAGAEVYSYFNRPLLTGADEVLLGAFSNTTGDLAFDDTLRQGLAVKLSESPFLNVVPEERVRATLALMKRPANETLTVEMAREICERESVKAVIDGNVNRLGSQYLITLEAKDCRTGKSLARLQAQADRKEATIRVLGQLASKLRRRLGESLKSISQYDMPLEEATTDSLEALKYYTLGRAKQRVGDYESAIALYRQSVALDPNFATAWRTLAQRLRWFGGQEEADQALQKAFELSGRTSEREKNIIAANYYYQLTGELEKAEAACLINLKLYPNDISSRVLLANVYADLGRWDESNQLLLQAQTKAPDYVMLKALLSINYKMTNRFQQAANLLRGPVEKTYPVFAYDLAFVDGNEAAMKKLAEETYGGPNDLPLRALVAETYQYLGKLQTARTLVRQLTHSMRRNHQPTDSVLATQALTEAEFGYIQEARALLAGVKEPSVILALAKAQTGDIAGASSVLDALSARYPSHGLYQKLWNPTVIGAIELQKGHPSEAVSALQIGVAYELGGGGPFRPDAFVRMYLRGYARLRLGQALAAAADFQKALDHRGLEPASPYYSLSYLGLARSYAGAGEMDKSLKAYELFLTIWKEADSDIPIYRQAKMEYAQMRRTRDAASTPRMVIAGGGGPRRMGHPS